MNPYPRGLEAVLIDRKIETIWTHKFLNTHPCQYCGTSFEPKCQIEHHGAWHHKEFTEPIWYCMQQEAEVSECIYV